MENSLSDSSTAWLETLRLQGRSKRTLETYGAALKNFLRFAAAKHVRSIQHVSPAHLQIWAKALESSGCQPTTRELFHRVLRAWFSWLVVSGQLFANPAAHLLSVLVPKRAGSCPTAEQMLRMLDGIRGGDPIALRDRALLEVAYATGARLNELTQLDLNSIDLAHQCVRLRGKGDRDRVAPLTRAACAALERYCTRSRPKLLEGFRPLDALFIGREGRRLASAAIACVVRRWGQRAGLKLAPHVIRRAFATHLFEAGASPEIIRQFLGHASYRHVWKYLLLPADYVHGKIANSNPQRR